ncbi:MAG: hypothetical protein ACYC8T_34015 [Myxococcaceae bacterium]
MSRLAARGLMLAAVSLAAAGSTPCAAQEAGLVGSWKGVKDQAGYALTLGADGQGTLNGAAVRWEFSKGLLRLEAAKGTYSYGASFTATTLALSGNDLVQPLLFERVAAARPASAAAATKLPIAGEPPLTQALVDKGSRFFEWLLDARLTEEQQQQFQDSLARSWTARNAEEIAGTLAVIKFYDDLAQKTEAERNGVREALLNSFLESMRQSPDDPMSRWVLGIYYSAHTPIAKGNPPLTRQVADAFAEVNCFMIGQVVGDTGFKPGKELKDQLATSLAAGYPGFSAQQQKEYQQLPLAWAAIRMTWPTLSEAEKAKYRRQWAPGVQAMLAPAEAKARPAAAAAAATTDKRTAYQKYEASMRTRRMLQDMNNDFLHRHVLSPGWTYTRHSPW